MIIYKLQCHKGHEFEGWFNSIAAYDRQAKRGLVECPHCGSVKVEKAVMAPRVKASKDEPTRVPVANPEAAKKAATKQEMIELMRKLRAEIEKNSDYVGPKFAEEARKIHYEEAEARGIHGEATPNEARELLEEGIEVYPLPELPEDKN